MNRAGTSQNNAYNSSEKTLLKIQYFENNFCMFYLILYFFENLQTLTKALCEFQGAIVVVSHDRLFLEKLEPTHVLSVRSGKATLEARGLRETDWEDDLDWRSNGSDNEDKCNGGKYATPAPSAKKTTVNFLIIYFINYKIVILGIFNIFNIR